MISVPGRRNPENKRVHQPTLMRVSPYGRGDGGYTTGFTPEDRHAELVFSFLTPRSPTGS